VNIVKAMCFIAREADDYENGAIEKIIIKVVESKGKNARITDIKHYLIKKIDNTRLKDLATMISPFCIGGKYEPISMENVI
jgi:ribosomal protein S3AE